MSCVSKQRLDHQRENLWVAWKSIPILCFYIVYLLIATLRPFEFSAPSPNSLHQFLETFLRPLPYGAPQLLSADFLYNFVFLIPCGFLFHQLLIPKNQRPTIGSFLLAGMSGATLSFLIELTQVFISARSPLARDVLANASGAFCGAGIFALHPIWIDEVLLEIAGSPKSLALLYLLGACPLILWLGSYPWFHFTNWDPRFTLQIGNEASLDYPWLGRIYRAAIFNRALSGDKIRGRFHAGFSSQVTEMDSEPGCIALYRFREGGGNIVHDVSCFDSPLDLTIAPVSAVRWLKAPPGIEFREPAIAKSRVPALKLSNAFKQRNELSVEVWVSPEHGEQSRPARIIALSRDRQGCNFVLGQDEQELEFRLRTPASGLAGNRVSLKTKAHHFAPNTSHIVVTYREGIEKLYLDGNEYAESVDLTANTVVGLRAKKTCGSQVAYGFCYFLPIGFFFANTLSRKSGKAASVLRTFGFVALPIGMLAAFRVVALGRPPDFSLMAYALTIGMLGAVGGALYGHAAAAEPCEMGA